MFDFEGKKYIKIGRIGRPHGVHGAFIIHSYNPDTSRLLKAENLFFLKTDPELSLEKIDSIKTKQANQGVIAKIKHITKREVAETLKNLEIVVLRDSLEALEKGEFYLADLLGLTVLSKEGKLIGKLETFLEAGSGLIFVIKNDSGKEFLIPFVDEFVVEINKEEGKIILDPVEGLLE